MGPDGWPDEPELESRPPVPIYSIALALLWGLPVFLYWALDFILTRRRITVEETDEPRSEAEQREDLIEFSEGYASREGVPVMLASLEHSLPHLPKARATAGGLGKVVDLIARKHPSDIFLVHPMLQEVKGKVEYGEALGEEPPVRLVVEGERHDVQVFRYASPVVQDQPRMVFLMLSHPLFEARTLDSIYPNPMSRKAVLTFFSLWNQAVGALLVRHKPQIFHCPDFHTAIAPWYAFSGGHPTLKMLLVLHNAEYQGTISTDMIIGSRLDAIASVFNLPPHMVQDHLLLDGRFNMLKAAVDFILEKQDGIGACAVSQWYAAECHAQYAVLWSLPVLHGLDNPMLEEERIHIEGNLAEAKADAKRRLQQRFGLEQNENARLFVSLGRLVRQKGVDLIADIADWLLSNFSDAQLILVGPVGDGFGHYAATKLEALKECRQHDGRLYVHIQFLRDKDALKDMKLGADFCLMPSRDEPFGYVDIEFAWHGALLVGAQAGGLGKVPGFYFLAQNRENLGRLRKELRQAVRRAMRAPAERLRRMAEEAVSSSFPLDIWQRRLRSAYKMVQREQEPCASESEGLRIAAPPGSMIEFSDAPDRRRSASFQPFGETKMSVSPSPGDVQGETAPVSIVDLAVGQGHALSTSFAVSANGPEFLTQELDEDELAERIRQKLQLHGELSIDEILVSVGEDVDLEREEGTVSRWLLERTFGVQRIHIIVAVGYVASPIAEFLTFVTATEWGLRGGESVPMFARRLLGESVDPPILNMTLFGLNALAFSISAPLWASLTRYIEPRKVMALSLMLQLPLLATLWPVYPKIEVALVLIFIHGMVTSASFLFLVFNFMMSIKADMSQYAIRLGALEMLRYVVNWLLTGYIFLASPSSLHGTKEKPLPTGYSLLLLPVAFLMIFVTAIPAVLLLFAPGPYKKDRFPGWNLELFFHKRSFVLLLISDCLGSLALFPGTCYITWWLSNGWSSAELSGLCILFAFVLAGGSLLWALSLSYTSVHGFSFLIGVAVMLAPPTMLRDLVQEEVATITSLGRSEAALVVSVLSVFLEGVRSSAMWIAKIRILNSRWRLLSYGTILQCVSHFCAFLSPIVCELLARMIGVTFITRNQKELADAIIISGLPLGLLQFGFQVAVAPFIKKDMGVSVGAERTRSLLHRLRKGTSVFAFSTMLAGSIVLICFTFLLLRIELGIDRVARCVQPHLVNCKVVVTEQDWSYGPNRFGQNTTGLYNCLHRMRMVGGDTFLFWESGICQVRLCGSSSELNSNATGDQTKLGNFELWSRYCDMARPDLLAVHLFDWPWKDVGNECESYLGPAGFNAVQVSPPTEHILGDSWSTRYQPVSYLLESRSGSSSEFKDMVKKCRAAKVNVMVDVVLNHMAGPFVFSPERDRGKACGKEADTEKESTVKCMGWAGTEYADRVFAKGRFGRDKFDRSMFHHYPNNPYSNCGLPPWSNNKRLCDMYGLPDLNTELKAVQQQLGTYLLELLEIGVTMLRVDAAMNIYPESLAEVILPFPWEYVVQEYYPDMLQDAETRTKVVAIGSATDFTFGQRVAETLFDRVDSGVWFNRSAQFGELLHLQQNRFNPCNYRICSSPYPTDRALIFLDNHDQQRERWKPETPGQPPASPVCSWDGHDIGSCRPIYKHGEIYHLAQLYMLAWPYGNPRASVRLMSSYGFHAFNEGPPGVSKDSMRETATSPVVCRDTPEQSPVTDAYDQDQTKPWVCEHRWKGVSGAVRFRQFTNSSDELHSLWDDELGHIAFSLGAVGFAAFSRGHNMYTGQGSKSSISLRGRVTGLPEGSYCNLAEETGAVPDPNGWSGRCAGQAVQIVNSSVVAATLPSGGAVILHVLYPSGKHAEGDAEAALVV